MLSRKLKWLWRSRENIIDMLNNRGYNIDEHLTFDEFFEWAGDDNEATIKESMTITEKKQLPKGIDEIMMVFWCLEDKLGDNIQKYITKLGISDTYECKPNTLTKSIIIVELGVTPSTKSEIKTLQKRGIHIDVFTLQEMQINVTKHFYVPLHTICSFKEKKKIMKEYAITKKDFPEICVTEPTIKHLCVPKGTLIRITEPSTTQIGEFSITFRLVR